MNKEEMISKFLQCLETALPWYIKIGEITSHSHTGYREVCVFSNKHTCPASLKKMVEEALETSGFRVSTVIRDPNKIGLLDEKGSKTAIKVILDLNETEKLMERVNFPIDIERIRSDQNNFSESRISATRPVQFSALLPSQQEELENKSYRERQLMEMMEKIRIKSGEHHAGFPF